MKIRGSITWFVVIVTTLIALLLWYGKMKPLGMPPAASTETNSVPSTALAPRRPINVPVRTNAPPAQLTKNAATPSKQDKGEQMKEGLAEMNDVPIVFYGRMADQLGNPVTDAQIAVSVRIYNGVQSTVKHSKTVSDGNGFFQIQGGKGESLGVLPTKEGYVLAATNTYFKYSYMYPDHFSPDPNNPTVIKMWKLQGAEPLVDISKEYKLPFIGVPISFDLVAGKIVPAGGDVKITVNRPAGEVSEHNPQDWGFEIEAVDGGLIETSGKEEAMTFAAPKNGYQSSDTLTASSNRHGIGGIQQSFFLESRNGQIYGKFGLLFGINEKPDDLMYIRFSGVANTNGSRNWEATAPQ